MKRMLQLVVVLFGAGATGGVLVNWVGLARAMSRLSASTQRTSLDARQVERKQMKLAMSVGTINHYRIDGVQRRHFIETGGAAGVSKPVVESVLEEIVEAADGAVTRLADELPARFHKSIHAWVSKAIFERLQIRSAGA